MKNLSFWGKNKKHSYFFGICKEFQWFGFMISTDNAITIYNYFLFEFRFLWLRIWYKYYFKD
jgi:hypothetical protein